MTYTTLHCDEITDCNWQDGINCSFKLNNGVDVWQLPVIEDQAIIKQLTPLLLEDELQRAKLYKRYHDSCRFICSRAGLRLLLGKYLNHSPKSIRFHLSDNKKPFVAGVDWIHYNVSHSGDLILIALAKSEVGIDAEKVDTTFDYRDIIEDCFSKEERDSVNSATNTSKSFYQLWTRKESLLKATAKGLDDDLPLIPSIDGQHKVDATVISSSKEWQVSSFNIQENYIGSITREVGLGQITFWKMPGLERGISDLFA